MATVASGRAHVLGLDIILSHKYLLVVAVMMSRERVYAFVLSSSSCWFAYSPFLYFPLPYYTRLLRLRFGRSVNAVVTVMSKGTKNDTD